MIEHQPAPPAAAPGEQWPHSARDGASRSRPRRTAAPLAAEAPVAQTLAAGASDPPTAAWLLAAAGGSRERLARARSLLSQRLHLHSDDFEATLALPIVERALAAAPYPDGPWRWQEHLHPRRTRAAIRRRTRARRRAERARGLRRRARGRPLERRWRRDTTPPSTAPAGRDPLS